MKALHAIDYITLFLAIALQIQITLFADGDYLGLRIGLADLFIPLIGLYVLFSLLTQKSYWPRWSMKGLIFWIAALTAVMSVSLVNGYLVNGTLSSWALINKYIGFLLLVSYLMLGGWIISNTADVKKTLALFVMTFTGFFVITNALSVLALFLGHFLSYPLWLGDYPWDGFMANRNAYMLVFVMAFCFIIWSYRNNDIKIPIWIHALFWTTLPTFFIFNDSRTGWLVSIPLVIMLLSKAPIKRAKLILPCLIIGLGISYVSYYATDKIAVLESRQMAYLLQIAEGTNYKGDIKRYIALEDGLELYKQHNPIIGAGLGSYKPFQIEKRGTYIEVIDFTGLWLLVETGALGLIIFAAFFITCLWTLYLQGFKHIDSSYHRAMLTFLILFSAMSILHELMYTRLLWFSVGLGIAHFAQKASVRKCAEL